MLKPIARIGDLVFKVRVVGHCSLYLVRNVYLLDYITCKGIMGYISALVFDERHTGRSSCNLSFFVFVIIPRQ